ncbi:MAG: hypothetical protein HOH33_00790, partial [Verrucomicrobia bacterium]|nr:hypothetical protein [Verrucomicrobiota bacterium]
FETPVIGSEHAAISIDVKVSSESVASSGGNYGYFELKRTDGTAFGGVNLTSTDWATIQFELAATEGEISGIIVQNGNSGFQGDVILFLDNLSFVPRQDVGSESPALTMEKAKEPSGLKLVASAFGQAYQRQNVVFVPSEDWGAGVYWSDEGGPMVYSVTWANFPDANLHAGFQGHIILSVDSGGGVSPDWNDPNVILVEFQYANWAGPDGEEGTDDDAVRARARFLHKINEPNGNAMLYRGDPAGGSVGVLGELWADSMIGEWQLTFQDLSNVAITAPDGNSVDFVLPSASAEALDGSLSQNGISALFGIQPNSDTRVGLGATISNIRIQKGNDVFVNETWDSDDFDPETWLVRAQDAGGIFGINPDLAYVFSWDLPDDGIAFRTASSLNGPWSQIDSARLVGNKRIVYLYQADLPSQEAGFFQLIQSNGNP